VDGSSESDDFLRAIDQVAREVGRPSSADQGMAEPSEFNDALHLAVMVENTAPLVTYLRSDMPVPRAGLQMLATWIEHITRRRSRGRPHGRVRGPVREAERLAGFLASQRRRKWHEDHPDRARISPAETAEMIAEVIKEAAKLTGIAESQINEDRVRSLLGLK
jgi:hypothetical protein